MKQIAAASNSTVLFVRVPTPVAERVDDLAERAGLNRSQFLRLLLARVDDEDVPSGIFAVADDLRPALRASA